MNACRQHINCGELLFLMDLVLFLRTSLSQGESESEAGPPRTE